ncbi:MAG: hypothetical protein AAFV19_04795 [Pseudomonadota bacterium]
MAEHRTLSLANRRFYAGPIAMFCMGVVALIPVLVFARRVILALIPGGPFLSSVVSVPVLLFTGLFLWLALIGFSPKLHQRFLRRRQTWLWRVLNGIGLSAAFSIVFLWGSVAARALGEAAFVQTAILVAAIPLYAMLAFAFFVPGAYAAALTARHERDTADPDSQASGEADLAAAASYGGPEAPSDAVWSDGSARMAGVKEDWRARVMARHDVKAGARDKARGRRGTHPEGTAWNPSMVVFLAVLVFTATGIYGFAYAQFLPSAEHLGLAESLRWPVVIGAGVLSGIAALIWPSKGRARMLAGPVGRTLGTGLVMAGFAAPLPVTAMATGLPALHSLVAPGTPASMRVTVVKQGAERRRRGCDLRVHVKTPGQTSAVLCEVPEDLWRRVRPGQTLTLDGHRTPYGFRYDRIR